MLKHITDVKEITGKTIKTVRESCWGGESLILIFTDGTFISLIAKEEPYSDDYSIGVEDERDVDFFGIANIDGIITSEEEDVLRNRYSQDWRNGDRPDKLHMLNDFLAQGRR